ncbi:AI-2E family transporter, partial [Streptomyces sp. SID9913]|nr:AI-2E family transporter [Streptomyces sp. SID9913]
MTTGTHETATAPGTADPHTHEPTGTATRPDGDNAPAAPAGTPAAGGTDKADG